MFRDQQHRWGMVIDLDVCTGCQACVVACHAENNVPTVGEVEVAWLHSQHWLRIERYWLGAYPQLKAEFLPMLCQHCLNAPCEPVCPMYATYHTYEDNLNIQVYNRCIGIRYCGANCPYKVRQFNWFNPYFPEPLNQQLNPDVTVRWRSIMEKCSFCTQRIRRAREDAIRRNVPLTDGDVQPACVQTCPTEALVFGDLNDVNSRISQLSRSGRGFQVLADMGTQPAITYLKRGGTNV